VSIMGRKGLGRGPESWIWWCIGAYRCVGVPAPYLLRLPIVEFTDPTGCRGRGYIGGLVVVVGVVRARKQTTEGAR
jgi:hypothetical protein